MMLSNNSFNPLVSIIIPVYNGSDFLAEAIDSALAQTYPAVEVIVVNDGSDDNGETEKTALSYGEKIRYFRKENGGVSTALNFGISVMRGAYFSWLSHDDLYTPEKIERQMEKINRLGDFETAVLCGVRQIDKNGNFIGGIQTRKNLRTDCVLGWAEVLYNLTKYGCFSGCSFLIPKEAFEKCGLFDANLRFSQDYLMWARVFLNKYSLIYYDEPDVYSRVHGGQLTQRGRDIFKKDSVYIADILIPMYTEISTKKQNFLMNYAEQNTVKGNFNVAVSCIKSGKDCGLFGAADVIKLRLLMLYGKIRPIIRRIYYRIFRKVKTN